MQIDRGNDSKWISTELINVCNGVKGISTEKKMDTYNQIQKTMCYTSMHKSDDKNFPYMCNWVYKGRNNNFSLSSDIPWEQITEK